MHIDLADAARFDIDGGRAVHRGEPGFIICIDEVGALEASFDFPVTRGQPVMRASRPNLWAFVLAFDEPVADVALTYLADVRHQLYWTDERGDVHPQEVAPGDLGGFRTARWAVGGIRVASLRCEFPLRLPSVAIFSSLEVDHSRPGQWLAHVRDRFRPRPKSADVPMPRLHGDTLRIDLADDLSVAIDGARAVVEQDGLRIVAFVDRPGPAGAQIAMGTDDAGHAFLRMTSEGMMSFVIEFDEPVSSVALDYAVAVPHRLEWTYANEAFIECEDVPIAEMAGLCVARRNAGDIRIRRLRCVYAHARADVALLGALTVTRWHGSPTAHRSGEIYIPWTLSPWRI